MYPSLEYFTTIISSMYRQGMEYATYSPKVSVNPISVMGWVCDGAFYMWKKSGYRYRVCRYQRANSYQVYRLRNRIIFRHTMTTNLGKSDNRKFLCSKCIFFLSKIWEISLVYLCIFHSQKHLWYSTMYLYSEMLISHKLFQNFTLIS